jgi:phosphoglycolate phosphatase-like HAD superfamily hydrolase
MKVFLFDIDGTLVNTGGAGRIAMSAAFEAIYGVCDKVEGVQFSGRTDRVIARDLALAHGFEDDEATWRRFRAEYLKRLPEALRIGAGRLLPGVESLLDELKGERDAHLGLLTGNVREGAHLKLSYYGVWDRFSFGGFGDESFERNEVAKSAFERAQEAINKKVDPKKVWVIGDTPLDVACARAIGANAVAVATGFYNADALAECKPDVLVEDLSQLTTATLKL